MLLVLQQTFSRLPILITKFHHNRMNGLGIHREQTLHFIYINSYKLKIYKLDLFYWTFIIF